MTGEERPQTEETQSFSRFLVMALIGVATTLLTELGEQDLPPTQNVLVILALNLVIPGIEQIYERVQDRPSTEEGEAPVPPQERSPRRISTAPLNGALIAILILLLLAGILLNFTLGVLLLIAWVVLIVVFVNAGRRLALGGAARSFLASVAAMTIGSALAFGGGTLIERVPGLINQDARPTVIVDTNCPLPESQEGQPDLGQPQPVPPVIVTVRRTGEQIKIDQVLASLLEPYLVSAGLTRQVDLPSQVQTIRINGRTLPPEGILEVDLGARQNHDLTIVCNEEQ